MNLDGPRPPITLSDHELLPMLAPFSQMPATAEAIDEFTRCAALHAEALTKLEWLTSTRSTEAAAAKDRRELGEALRTSRPATPPRHTIALAEETAAARLAVAALRDVRVDAYDLAIAAVAAVAGEVEEKVDAARATAATEVDTLARGIVSALGEVDRALADLGVVTSILTKGEVSLKGARYVSATTALMPASIFTAEGSDVRVDVAALLAHLADGVASGVEFGPAAADDEGFIGSTFDEDYIAELGVFPAAKSEADAA